MIEAPIISSAVYPKMLDFWIGGSDSGIDDRSNRVGRQRFIIGLSDIQHLFHLVYD
jgi:hypothetical protein